MLRTVLILLKLWTNGSLCKGGNYPPGSLTSNYIYSTINLVLACNFTTKNITSSVALAWSVESLPSNTAAWVRFPAESGILISVLGLGVCPLSVFCPVLSPAEALTLCLPHIQGGPPLCICPVFWSTDCCSSYRRLTLGYLGCLSRGVQVQDWGRVNKNEKEEEEYHII